MTSCTPVYGFPFPTGADAPCDVATPLCDLATDVEAQLEALDAVAGRTITSIPMAQLRRGSAFTTTAPGTFGLGTDQSIPFDIVDVDTDNMVDLSASAFNITLPMFGRYTAVYNLAFTGTNSGTNFAASVRSYPTFVSAASDGFMDTSTGPYFMNATAEFVYSGTANPPLGTAFLTASPNVYLNLSAATVITITSASFAIYWVGDL